MNSKLIALGLFAATTAAVAFYPAAEPAGAAPSPAHQPAQHQPHQPAGPAPNERPRIEVVFVLDTTGSMGGLIQAAKEKIWSIASTMAAARPAPQIRMGLVAYRDRGDDYVTRVVDLSADLDAVYATLMDFRASGGGDGPESVNQALHEAVHRISWSEGQDAYKVVFLVGDAPPHMDYPDDVKYPVTLAAAVNEGIVVNAIQCGSVHGTTREWRTIASLGAGDYFQVGQSGSAVAIATPYDAQLAKLSADLDGTRLYYGSAEDKARAERKLEAATKLHAAASVASRARRAQFNATESGAANFLGEGELVDDVASGRVDLKALPETALPAPLQALAPAERGAAVARTAEQRSALKREIRELAEQRSAYLRQRVDAAGGAGESLDRKIFGALRDQAKAKGIDYEADALAY